MELMIERAGEIDALTRTHTGEEAERAARHALRRQIAKLERDLADAFVTAAPMGGIAAGAPDADTPRAGRLLGLAELETIRDTLAVRVREARGAIAERAEAQAEARARLEQMFLEPGRHRFTRVSLESLGEPGCGVWQVRPRLGLIGMLAGWWHVKLSSGCPLPRGHGRCP